MEKDLDFLNLEISQVGLPICKFGLFLTEL